MKNFSLLMLELVREDINHGDRGQELVRGDMNHGDIVKIVSNLIKKRLSC